MHREQRSILHTLYIVAVKCQVCGFGSCAFITTNRNTFVISAIVGGYLDADTEITIAQD